MLIVEARVTSRVRLHLQRPDNVSMRSVGIFGAQAVGNRIQRGLNVRDEPAPPLCKPWQRVKVKRGAQPVRNWTFSGNLMRLLTVTSVSANSFEIGWTDSTMQQRVAIMQWFHRGRGWPEMFGFSPNDARLINVEIGRSQIGRVEFRKALA